MQGILDTKNLLPMYGRLTVAEHLPDSEVGRRISASRGYRRETVKEFAERINADRHDLAKWEAGDFGSDNRPRRTSEKREQAIRRAREVTRLPDAFFSIDFAELPAMVAAWRRAGGDDSQEPPSTGPSADGPDSGDPPPADLGRHLPDDDESQAESA